jgi:hypothetical protein
MRISISKTKGIGTCGKNIERVKIEIDERVID